MIFLLVISGIPKPTGKRGNHRYMLFCLLILPSLEEFVSPSMRPGRVVRPTILQSAHHHHPHHIIIYLKGFAKHLHIHHLCTLKTTGIETEIRISLHIFSNLCSGCK